MPLFSFNGFYPGRLPGRERLAVALALALVTGLSWLYMLWGAGTGMSTLAMTTWEFPPPAPAWPMQSPWTPAYALLMVAMWQVMMMAMMLPAAAPAIISYREALNAIARQGGGGEKSPAHAGLLTAAFTAGYLGLWLLFSLSATFLQWILEAGGLVDGMFMWSVSRWLTAALLLTAALYQFLPFKHRCLCRCRAAFAAVPSPRQSMRAAFAAGARHGRDCLSCCGVLMLACFAGGLMNLVWMAALSALVLAERLAPARWRLELPIGAVFAALGVYALFA